MDYTALIWAVLGLLFIGVEFFIPGFVIFFFGLGALGTALLSAVFPFINSSITLQIVIWLTSSVLSLVGLRKYFAKAFKGKMITGLDDNAVAGSRAVVIEDISPGKPGRIRFQGTTWTALSFDEVLPAGKTVEILQKEGLTFTVTSSLLEEEGKDLV